MNIILFGPPGAGKGTQSQNIVKKFKLHQLSTGDLLRNEIKNKTKIGKKIEQIISQGDFASDDIVNKLLKNLEMQQNFSIALTKKNNVFNNLDINIDLTNKKESLSLGLDPKKQDWGKILQIASRIYVPESDESREKGAGGGDAND